LWTKNNLWNYKNVSIFAVLLPISLPKNIFCMDKNKQSLLFENFPPVSTADWEAKIIEDLKGADYEKRLIWKTNEGIPVRPYYRAEDLETLPFMESMPGEAPYLRGTKTKNNDWIIRQDFEEADPEQANRLAREALEKGAQAIGLNIQNIETSKDLNNLLEGIDLEKVPLHFQNGTDYPAFFEMLVSYAGEKSLKGSLDFDPLAWLLLYERFHKSRDASFDRATKLINMAKDHQPEFRVINIHGQHTHNAGANMVQELAYGLSQAVEYLAAFTEKGLKPEEITPHLQFTFAIGSSYFMEIAKLRVARVLWSKVVEAFIANSEKTDSAAEKASKMFIHAVTSNRNKSIYDPYVNMLRTTTEAMSASIGGADSLCVTTFDHSFKKPDDFGYRMARNQQIILKHEAYFGKVADPAAGSYYIENLTHELAQASWKLFTNIEAEGGFIRAVESENIRKSIEEMCQKRDQDIAIRKRIFVGTNQYANSEERVLDKVEPRAQLSDMSALRQYRGPQAFEALRMAVENHAKKGFDIPKVFLFTYGNPAMRKARATFSGNFFSVAGYQIIDNLGFGDIKSGVQAATDTGATIVVFCSSDEEYLEMAPAAKMIKESNPETIVIVAGNPREIINELNDAGVDHYIHIRTNVLESLTRYNEILGIV